MKNKLLTIIVICANYHSHRYMDNTSSNHDCPSTTALHDRPFHQHNSPLPGQPHGESLSLIKCLGEEHKGI